MNKSGPAASAGVGSAGAVVGDDTDTQDEEDQVRTVSQFPPPPMEYISFFTNENVNSGKVPLAPACPRPGDYYTAFGCNFCVDDENIIQPLESQNIRRLYPTNFDRKRELKQLLHSVLGNFLDLLDILVYCPRSLKRKEKLDDLSLLLIHMQHLVNELRPHQARETVRLILEVQKLSRLEVCENFTEKMTEITEQLTEGFHEFPIANHRYLSTLKRQIRAMKESLAEFRKSHGRKKIDDSKPAPDQNIDESETLGEMCIEIEKNALITMQKGSSAKETAKESSKEASKEPTKESINETIKIAVKEESR